MRKEMLYLFLISIFTLQAYRVDVNQSNSQLFNYQQLERGEIDLSFQLDGYDVEQIEREGVEYLRIIHSQSSSLLETGMPELPAFTTIIAIPGQGKVDLQYEFGESEIWHDVTLYPQEEWQDDDIADKFRINEDYYSNGGKYPIQRVTTSGAAIMRDLRILPITVSPFQYNAESRELEIISEINVRVSVSGTDGENEKANFVKISRAFEPMYKSMVLNYDDVVGRPEYQQPTLVFVIKDMDDALETLEYLKDWKRQKGYNVVVATTSETGTSNSSIKNYLQDAYDDWENPPEYICFCGDATGSYAIPSWGEGDHPYAQLDGTDVLEDVIIGRLSFENISTFQVLISKIFYYEKEPYMNNTDWYSQALLTGDPSSSEMSTVFTCLSIKEMMLDYPDNFDGDDDFTEVYSGSFSSQMNAAINSGISFMAYRGYLGMSGWSPGGQSNGFMMPFSTILTCGSGSWVSGIGASEAFSRQGTVTLPSGAIGCVGTATWGTHTCFNNALTLGIYGSIFRDGIYTMGGALTFGKYYLYSTFPQNPGGYVNTFSLWNTLMGDPSLEVWTDVPEELNVIAYSSIPMGSNYMHIEVRDSANTPLEGAWVTLTNETETYFATGYCSETGEVFLDLDGAEIGDYDLVVTSHNFIPHLGTVEIETSDQYVELQSVIYNDDVGNNDGILNPGEIVQIIPTFHNYGNSGVDNVFVEFYLAHSHISLVSDEMTVGDIPAGGEVSIGSGVDVQIYNSAIGGMQGRLEMTISDDDGNSWTSWHYLNVAGADLCAIDYITAGGILEPGVESDIYFIIENLGSTIAENIDAELICLNPRLIITDSLASFGNVNAGGHANNSGDVFTVTPSVTIISGTQLEVELHLSNASGYSQISRIVIPVGEVDVTDPMGPDAYGYWCYDDEDLGYELCPEYDWIEIDPDLGGDGTIINLIDPGDNGDLEHIDLPAEFTLSFYGIEYDEMTVCSNGWLAPGYQESANFMNHSLPGPQGASPMIAVFWDDMNVNSGNVCWLFDETEHYLVVEWSECQNGDTGADETFQIILYDPNFYQTMTDDSLIKMQYKEVNNNNAGSYPYNHGQFCTVGIENETSMIGMTYTFNNTYPDAAKTLEDEMAILFSPPQYPEFGPYLEIVSYEYLAGDDQHIEAGETVNLSVMVGNQGAEEATDVDVELEVIDNFITVTDGDAFIEYIEALGTYQLSDEFSFEVAGDVPDNYEFTAQLTMTTVDDYWFTNLSFTAHWINAFLLDVDSIDVVLAVDLTTERTFTLSNVSEATVNYYLRLDEESRVRDITGSYVDCDTDMYIPGEGATWEFTVFNCSQANEWVSDVWLDFPPGITVLSSSAAYGGSGGNMEWDGTTGDGAYVNWHGETINEWGVLHDGEFATWEVAILAGEDFASDIQVEWQIGGDGYGNDPHIVNGELNFDFYIEWISLDSSFGTLAPGESDEITIYYDAHGMEIGEYNCVINILSDSWFSDFVETAITIVGVGEDDDIINPVTMISGICPNPFNPSTEIRFELAASSLTELSIYNIKGQKVKELLSEVLDAGMHKIIWNGTNDNNRSVGSGIYYLQLRNLENVMTRKMILLK